tara:strand:- start:6890 stop:7162 length:273 start_codon:yes stop_codon:yes gene_type:complete
MGLFAGIRGLVYITLFIGIFFIVFGEAIPLIGTTVNNTAGAGATVGGKSISDLVNNVFNLLIWIPIVALGGALYLAISELLDRERSSGRF